jgi:predicted type IV restriction endonuclease
VAAPEELRALVQRFARSHDAYVSGGYKETQLRREFLDPLFQLLGWDVGNEKGYAEAYKDVVHEDAVKIGRWTKAPDYAFRVGGVRKFFAEAKAPHRNLKQDPEPAFQLRRYAWSAKLPLSILTDFEEFAVYDTRVRPHKTDRASTARTIYVHYSDYAARWDEIAAIFSRDAILRGSFDGYVESQKRKRGTAEVDQAFLAEIERWRDVLARNVALRNPTLGLRALNSAVQRTIDRVVFLRICEDRGIEPYAQMLGLLDGPGVYGRLVDLFRRADQRYNSGLFHFHVEHGRQEAPDEVTPRLSVDDEVLRSILKSLYYPDSPYEFSVLPADILGQVYEQFLGKVITLTASHRARVEEKPEVRKTGGVFYTPSRVVDYLVSRSVGALLEEARTPNKADALRILDPACGSGSFLISAYQRLLDWYLAWYQENGAEIHAKGRNARLFQGPGGAWRLTTAERKRILRNCIFGVDIDPQAVEVTKLSLLLKVLEGESADSLESQLRLFRERALPDLAANIKCGNSLVGPDFYADQERLLFDEQQTYEVNAFDWGREFAAVLDSGGFHAVVGNPPYLSYSGRQAVQLDPRLRQYYLERYPGAGWLTSHGLFIARAHELSQRKVAFVVPDQVGHLEGYASTRKHVAWASSLVEVRYWGENVFPGVVTPALTFVSDKRHRGPAQVTLSDGSCSAYELASGAPWLSRSPDSALVDKLLAQSESLDACFADPGVHTGNCSSKLVLPRTAATSDAVPVLEGKQVSRYACLTPTKALRLGYAPKDGEYFTIRPIERYSSAPFVVRQTAAFPIVGPRRHADYFRNSLLALYPPDDGRDVRFVVALLNSRLLRFAYRVSVQESGQKAFPQVKVRSLRSLPFRRVDFTCPDEKAAHDSLVRLADTMLALNVRVEGADTDHEREVLRRRIAATDGEIDSIVEGLYGLSDVEVQRLDAFFAER